MAISKVLIASFLLSTLLIQFVQPTPVPAPTGSVISPAPGGFIDCDAACLVRCSKSSRPNLCQRACGSCCKRCNCVPPGTYGNYDKCECYASLTTRDGKRKCP
ncbi:gibberellin-regulated protein 1-like [Chenopodium quinoa]|uniref:gibberellin-regulated protein 1-like n=1 Tax=Chenopodium quinoa TaxID=63459 RepID=UPI000B781A41|nr:gibberellin-regulated protein 1-like [Chenopodium quinoa]